MGIWWVLDEVVPWTKDTVPASVKLEGAVLCYRGCGGKGRTGWVTLNFRKRAVLHLHGSNSLEGNSGRVSGCLLSRERGGMREGEVVGALGGEKWPTKVA